MEEEERRSFCNAFVTEIGQDFLNKKTSFREVLDVIVCAGRDVGANELQELWPRGDLPEEKLLSQYYTIVFNNYNKIFR